VFVSCPIAQQEAEHDDVVGRNIVVEIGRGDENVGLSSRDLNVAAGRRK